MQRFDHRASGTSMRPEFWLGTLLVTVGVAVHLPMYWQARLCGFRLVGMPMGWTMTLGMLAILAGLLVSLLALRPETPRANAMAPASIRPMDDVALGRHHYALLAAMAVAVTIDVMKPTALAFVVPGMTAEYDLKSPLNPTGKMPAAYLALAGISGTVLGSIVWGWLGDRIGRRASILFAGLNFVGTSICGVMPSYEWNLFMCAVMGLGVGGMLPIAYALLTETIPARHRGWLTVLVGADVAGAYLLTSWLSAELTPLYGWRILWLIGLPTGLAFIALNRWIPESPRYLLSQGRDEEAYRIMQRFGARVLSSSPGTTAASPPRAAERWKALLQRPHGNTTLLASLLAVGSGVVLFGFNLWIPSNLRKLGVHDADAVLRNAAAIGLPLTFLVAWMYGFWSTRKTILVLTAVTASALLTFAWLGDSVVAHRGLLQLLLVAPTCGVSAIVAVVSVYSAEAYPTTLRARGAGLCAAMAKAGGVCIILFVILGLAPPAMRSIALYGAVPMTLAFLATLWLGTETRHRSLEQIGEHEPKRPGQVASAA